MRKIELTAFDLAQRFVGLREEPGARANPRILAMLKLDGDWPQDDETAWCSAFVNEICWLLRLPRSKKLNARSWLGVGRAIGLAAAEPGFDVVVLSRGPLPQPGPSVTLAPGHVGFFAGRDNFGSAPAGQVLLLGGNQGDAVSIAAFPIERVLGVRRLYE